jgi:hypothetical protein
MKKFLDNYKKPTPVIWRKIGDSVLIASASLSTAVMGLPISEHNKLYIVFALNVLGVIGKILTNLFKKD